MLLLQLLIYVLYDSFCLNIIKICDRKFIGCDQLIFVNENIDIDAELEFYNSDGSKSDACGNGTRCVAHLLSKEKEKNERLSLALRKNLKKRKIFQKKNKKKNV